MSLSLSELKASLASLKEKIKKVVKMCESTDFKQVDALEILTESLIDVVDIKCLNAKIQLETESARDECLNEVHKAEEQNLNYQNYIYQKDTILNQIVLCNSYQTPEVNKIFPTHKDNHIKVNIDMLKEELTKRKELNEKLLALTEEKKENHCQLEQNQSFAKSLPQYLKNLETSTLQAQKLFNVNISERKRNDKLAQQLPQPLYVLYYSFLAISDINDSSVQIIGEEKEVEAFLLEYPNDSEMQLTQDLIDINSKEEGEQSDEGEITIKNTNNSKINSRHSPNANPSLIKKKKLRLHPLMIELTLSSSIKINFSYLPIANIVCMEAKAKGYSNEELLSCIYPFKECIYTPLINERLPDLLSTPSSSMTLTKSIIFYEYIQILSNNSSYNLNSLLSLCDIDNNKSTPSCDDNAKSKPSLTMITVDSFAKELFHRIKMLPLLKDQVTCLMTKNEFSSSLGKVLDVTLFKAKISHFEEITQEDYFSQFNSCNKSSSDEEERRRISYITVFGYDDEGNLFKEIKVKPQRSYSENEAKYYLIEIKRKTVALKVKVELGFDYPRSIPRMKVSLESSDQEQKIPESMKRLINTSDSKSIYEIENELLKIEREIEEVINNGAQLDLQQHQPQKKQPFQKEDELRPYLFSIQIMKLLVCVDTLVEIKKSDKPMYNSLIKGKSKFLPHLIARNQFLFKY